MSKAGQKYSVLGQCEWFKYSLNQRELDDEYVVCLRWWRNGQGAMSDEENGVIEGGFRIQSEGEEQDGVE